MDKKNEERFELHMKKIIIANMKYALETLNCEDLPECVFNFMINKVTNGIEFLKNERKERKTNETM